MKKYFLFIALSVFLNFSYSQINRVSVKKQEDKKEPYDSLKNYLGKDYLNYVGQTLYVKGKSYYNQNSRLDGFGRKPYKYGGMMKYTEVGEKFFLVDTIYPYDSIYPGERFMDNKFFLKLIEKENKDTVYYSYDSEMIYPDQFPFMVMGYYEKLKNTFIGKKLILKFHSYTDIETGEDFISEFNELWTLIDIPIDEESKELRLLFENDKGRKRLEGLYYIQENNYSFTQKEAANYVKKFGINNWQNIINSQVKIGFTEEMVILAIGEPNYINKASYGDQWVYDNQYFYFKNGKLTSYN